MLGVEDVQGPSGITAILRAYSATPSSLWDQPGIPTSSNPHPKSGCQIPTEARVNLAATRSPQPQPGSPAVSCSVLMHCSLPKGPCGGHGTAIPLWGRDPEGSEGPHSPRYVACGCGATAVRPAVTGRGTRTAHTDQGWSPRRGAGLHLPSSVPIALLSFLPLSLPPSFLPSFLPETAAHPFRIRARAQYRETLTGSASANANWAFCCHCEVCALMQGATAETQRTLASLRRCPRGTLESTNAI